MSDDDKSRTFQESLVASYFEFEIRRVWGVLGQIVEAEGPKSDARDTLIVALQQAWIRFINCLRENEKYRHLLLEVLRKEGFEETMPYRKKD